MKGKGRTYLAILGLTLVLIVALTGVALALQPWARDAANPVLVSDQAWEGGQVYDPYVLKKDAVYHMWYTARSGPPTGIGYASSADGVVWTKTAEGPGGNPVLSKGAAGQWDDVYVAAASVIWTGSQYVMWYRGRGSQGDAVNSAIGCAASPDGMAWTKFAGNPVLVHGGPGEFDGARLSDPWVIVDGSKYRMYYAGWSGNAYEQQIGLAETTARGGCEGTWTKSPANPVLPLGPAGAWDDAETYSPSVIKVGSVYKMWYAGTSDSSDAPPADTVWIIGFATSPDGMAWIRDPGNPAFSFNSGSGCWDCRPPDDSVDFQSVLWEGGVDKMWYSAGGAYQIGLATMSEEPPTAVTLAGFAASSALGGRPWIPVALVLALGVPGGLLVLRRIRRNGA